MRRQDQRGDLVSRCGLVAGPVSSLLGSFPSPTRTDRGVVPSRRGMRSIRYLNSTCSAEPLHSEFPWRWFKTQRVIPGEGNADAGYISRTGSAR
jgi:hypothetical protein